MRSQCTHIKDDGQRCGSKIVTASGMCIAHDPARRGMFEAITARGGEIKARNEWERRAAAEDDAPAPPETLDDIVSWTSWLTRAVATGKLDHRIAREVTNALNSMRGSLEKRDVLAEIDRLKDQVASLRSKRPVSLA